MIIDPLNSMRQLSELQTDTSNEFVYNVCDSQGKLLLSINTHGDVVVNELIARKIHNGELSELLLALNKLSSELSEVSLRTRLYSMVAMDYTSKILEAILVKGSFSGFSIKTGYSDTQVVSVVNLDLCAQKSTAGFCMYTTTDDTHQYVAYYDYHHQLSVAMRTKTNNLWSDFAIVKLDSFVGYDGHNYIHMIVDNDGCLHLCANMHCDSLNYWYFTHPYSLENYVKVPMTGCNEDSVTYPFFIRLQDGRVMFAYRDGVSGCGNHYVNFLCNGKWTTHRLIFNGKDSDMSAYCCGMIGDFNGCIYNSYSGYYELFFAWRETGDPSTTCKLCYVRTEDFLNFKNLSDVSVALPISPSADVEIDSVPHGGGLVNSVWRVLQTNGNGTLFCYHKYNQNQSQVNAVLIKNNSKLAATVVTWSRKLTVNDLLTGFSLSLKEDSDSFIVRCGNSYDGIKRYNLDKSTLVRLSTSAAGDDFYDYPSCIRQSLDNEDQSVYGAISLDLNSSKYLAKYEYSKDGRLSLPTYLKVIEYT